LNLLGDFQPTIPLTTSLRITRKSLWKPIKAGQEMWSSLHLLQHRILRENTDKTYGKVSTSTLDNFKFTLQNFFTPHTLLYYYKVIPGVYFIRPPIIFALKSHALRTRDIVT